MKKISVSLTVIVIFLFAYLLLTRHNSLVFEESDLENPVRYTTEDVLNPETLTFEDHAKSGDTSYSKDGSYVYWDKKVIEGADPVTIKLFVGTLAEEAEWLVSRSQRKLELPWVYFRYAADASSVYYEGRKVAGADPKTFEVWENGKYTHYYGRDKNGFYFHEKLITGADEKTFEVLWTQRYEGCGPGPYSKDKNRIYFGNTVVVGADIPTFTLLINDYAKDKNSVYLRGVKQSVDPATFETECTYG